jgi:hypothetical protein
LWRQNSTSGIILVNGIGTSYSMSIDQDLNIYTSEHDHNRIKKWFKHTNYTISITIVGNGWDYLGNFLLSDLRIFYLDEKTETIYILNSEKSSIVKWRLGDETGEIIYSNQILSSAKGIKFDCNINIYFSNSSFDEIYQINILTNQVRSVLIQPRNFYGQYMGFEFDSFGNLYLSDVSPNQIIKYSIIR